MKSDSKLMFRIADLALHSLNGTLDEQSLRNLEELLENNPLAAEYYVEILWTHIGLDSMEGISSLQEVGNGAFDQDLWQALAENEKMAPGILVGKPIEKSVDPRLGLMKVKKLERKISRLSVYTLILSAAAMLFLMILVLSSPIRPIVATLTDSINAEWISEEDIPAKWDVLRQGELTLVKGLAEITFNDGAVVVVEAPAVIELESPKSMFLHSGKVSALVSEYATGFTVNTLSASIVDLGTEFGVSVKGDGSCSLHMFKGKANLIAGRKDEKRTVQIVNVNEARSVDSMSGAVRDIRLGEKSFVRQIDSEKGLIWCGKSLNLADVVGGGDGFGTGRYESGIDLETGQYTQIMDYKIGRPGPDVYLRVTTNKMIDGVFVPDGGDGDVQIDSSGNIFAGCPDTSGFYWTQIANSGFIGSNDPIPHHAVLGGVEYSTNENPSILMHPNVGITFDLNKIREDLPGIMISKFEAICGVSESVIRFHGEDIARNAKTDFWVFIDGEEHFEAIGLNPIAGLRNIQVEIKSEDRFLTLIATDGDMKGGCTWAIFGNPALVLKSR